MDNTQSPTNWVKETQEGAFQVYRTWLALKLHFDSSNYDFFQYGGNVSLKFETFIKSKNLKPAMRLYNWLKRSQLSFTEVAYAYLLAHHKTGSKGRFDASVHEYQACYQEWMSVYGTKALMKAHYERLGHLTALELVRYAIKNIDERPACAYCLYFKDTPADNTMNVFDGVMHTILLKHQMFYSKHLFDR